MTEHICDYCSESFATYHELGGHVTGVHRHDQLVTDADVILDDIRRVAAELGKPPTAKEMIEHGGVFPARLPEQIRELERGAS